MPYDPIDVAVGARLRIRRRWMGWSQTQLAEALGITFQQVQKYERGANRISASRMVRAAAVLQCTVAFLVGEEGREGPADATELASLQFMALPGAGELLQAWAAIEDRAIRRAAITLLRAIKGGVANAD